MQSDPPCVPRKPPPATPQPLDQPESPFRRHSEKLQLVSSIQMKRAGPQMRPISPQSRSGGARRGSRSQIEVRVNDSSNSLSCVMLTARLSRINSNAHSRPGIWFQMEPKSGRWNVQFCWSFEEAYWALVPLVSFSSSFLSQLLRKLLVYYFSGSFLLVLITEPQMSGL